jgi:LmbE family N-acetylglucosaminyl deacetylase
MTVLAISPHYDDAIWSAGAHLAALVRTGTPVMIVTVFATPPPANMLTAHDAKCGTWPDSATAVAARRRENIRACTVTGASDLDGPFSDSQYGTVTTENDVCAWLEPLARSYNRIIAPLGTGHPDHRVVGDAARRAVRRLGLPLTVYEEIPTRVWDPPEPVHLIDSLLERWAQAAPSIETPTAADYATKAAASECYTSQVDPDIRRVLAVPERLWDLTWQGDAR